MPEVPEKYVKETEEKMATIDMNDVAVKISEKEGLKEQVDIAQIKEVSKNLLMILANDYTPEQREELFTRYKE